jgi:PAS domain S-box-containing protein
MREQDLSPADTLGRFQAALRRAPVVLFAHDRDLRYTWVYNPAFGAADEILGKTDADIVSPASAAVLTEIKADVLRTGVGARRQVRLELPVGVRDYDLTVEPIHDADGQVSGVACTALDITEQVEAEAAWRGGEERLRLAQAAAGIGIHDYDPVRGHIRWDARVRELWGVGPDEPVTFDLFMSGLHPDDQAPTRAAVDRALDPAGGGHYHAEFRVTSRRDGVERWVVATGHVSFAGGRAVRLVGTVHDVTAQKRAEADLRASEERFRLAADAVNGIIYEFDPRTERVERTRGLAEVLGHRPDEVPPTAAWWWDQIHPDDRPIAGALSTGGPTERSTSAYRVRHKDGRWLHVEDRAVVLRDPDGRPLRMIGCTVDVTDRTLAEEALRQADRKKDEFLATLAHELRNPLAPIRNAVEALRTGGPAPVGLHGVIDRQVRVMARLLDDLLDVSRITRGKLDLRRERVDLASVVAAAVETSRPLLDAAGHQLAVDLPAEPVALDADPVRLAQVFANLLNNAAKYTDPGGHVRLSAARTGEVVAVTVADDGMGIAADMLPRLFAMFAQAEPAVHRAQGGLGIGLALVRGLVELHGGSIAARSPGPGRGSAFTVHLPVAAAVPAPPPTPASHPPRASPCRVLVADDLRDSADSMALLLEVMGHDVRTAYDGEQAVTVAGEFRPDVVLLDLGMPKMNGFEACRRIRQQPWGRRVRLVALTGWGQEEDRQRTSEAGFDHHLVKPVSPADLEQVLAAPRGPSPDQRP